MLFLFRKLLILPEILVVTERSDALRRKDCSGHFQLTVKDDQVESLLFIYFYRCGFAVWFFSFFGGFHDKTRFELECANDGIVFQIAFKLGERHLTNLVA